MARPKKQSVEYFPHYAKTGRTIFILENKFGNDGYAFWFKVLEILAESDGHYFDCSNSANWEFLLAKTHCSKEIACSIIDTLIDLQKIDRVLWDKRIIWVQNLVDNFVEIYRKRCSEVPQKPYFCDENTSINDISAAETPQSKVKESKEKENKIYPYQDIADKWNSICGAYLPKVQKLSDSRKQKIKARLNEFGCQETWLPTVEALFDQIITSDFLRGKNNNNWTATFDWVFDNPKNWVKVMEGNYNNNRGNRTTPTQPDIKLGVGEYIDDTGRRTYGTGRATIPYDAPPRPSERYSWNASNSQWILL